MNAFDYKYITSSIMQLYGIPTRLFENDTQIFECFPYELPKDPFEIYKDEILKLCGHVNYFCTPYFHYYGVLNFENIKIVVGPTGQIMANEQKLKEIAFILDVMPKDVQTFIDGMNKINHMPVETLIKMLCLLNHLINKGETIDISDITIDETHQREIKSELEIGMLNKTIESDHNINTHHNTLVIEEALMGIVRKGDTIALKRWMSSIPTINAGTIAGDQLRQMRNLFIVTATLVSRAAIHGGMIEEDAFSLSDAYIQRVEMLNSYDNILNLQYHMIYDFTERIEKLHRGDNVTKLSIDVSNYIRQHLSKPIKIEKMAEEFYLSRPYLSSKFKQETGKTLTDFILNEKIEEAKRLLRYTNKTLSSISSYLGFSSQSHFIRVFHKYAGINPSEYMDKHRK